MQQKLLILALATLSTALFAAGLTVQSAHAVCSSKSGACASNDGGINSAVTKKASSANLAGLPGGGSVAFSSGGGALTTQSPFIPICGGQTAVFKHGGTLCAP